jgi:glycosyltransferase involved in cell wall biosynthesis
MFNEEESLETTLERLAGTLAEFRDGPWEVVVVNDGSEDRSWDLAQELALRPAFAWLRVSGYARNRGRGYALRTGFAAARGEWIVAIDADLSYDPSQILDLVRVLREEPEVDLVLASAYMSGGRVEGVPWRRRMVSRVGNRLLGSFMASRRNPRIHTITCVFRAYRRHVLDMLELESEGKDIHLEILSKALMLGFKVKEVPATLRARKRGVSKHRFSRTAVSHLVFALFERPVLVLGLGGLILLLISLGIMSYLFSLYIFGVMRGEELFNPNRPLMTVMVMSFLGGIQLLVLGIVVTQLVDLRKEIVRIQARMRQWMRRRADDEDDAQDDGPEK